MVIFKPAQIVGVSKLQSVMIFFSIWRYNTGKFNLLKLNSQFTLALAADDRKTRNTEAAIPDIFYLE